MSTGTEAEGEHQRLLRGLSREWYSSVPNKILFYFGWQFLDVYAPTGVKPGDDVPVLVWIYGGAYTVGSKDDAYMNPSGLFRTAQKPVIFVALNYR